MDRERLKARRLEKGYTLQNVADKIGVTRATVQKYESGAIKGVDTEVLERLATVLHTTPTYLMGWDDDPQPGIVLQHPRIAEDYVTFPVIGDVAAGYDKIAVEDWSGDTVDIPTSYLRGRKVSDFFVLKVVGDSMYPLYMEGDKVLILRQTTLNHSGDIGAILYDDENVTLKKVEYVQGENWLRMLPINPEYMPKTIEGEALEHCRVLGVPVLLIREI